AAARDPGGHSRRKRLASDRFAVAEHGSDDDRVRSISGALLRRNRRRGRLRLRRQDDAICAPGVVTDDRRRRRTVTPLPRDGVVVPHREISEALLAVVGLWIVR